MQVKYHVANFDKFVIKSFFPFSEQMSLLYQGNRYVEEVQNRFRLRVLDAHKEKPRFIHLVHQAWLEANCVLNVMQHTHVTFWRLILLLFSATLPNTSAGKDFLAHCLLDRQWQKSRFRGINFFLIENFCRKGQECQKQICPKLLVQMLKSIYCSVFFLAILTFFRMPLPSNLVTFWKSLTQRRQTFSLGKQGNDATFMTHLFTSYQGEEKLRILNSNIRVN